MDPRLRAPAPPSPRHHPDAGRTGRPSWVSATALYAAGSALTVLFIAISSSLPVLAVPLAAVLLVLIAVFAYGPERVGNAFMLIAVLTGPMMSLRPLYPAVGFVTASDLAVVIGLGLLLPTMARRHLQPPPQFLIGWVLLIVGGVVASLVASPDPATSINYLIRFILAGFVLPLVFLMWSPTLRQVRIGAAAYLLGHVISTGAAFIKGPLTNDRYTGLTNHPLFFGPAGLLATGFGLYLLGRTTRTSHRLLILMGLAACLASVVMSGSRACLLVAVFMYIAFAVTHRSYVTVWSMLAGAAALLVSFQQILARSTEGSAISRLAGDNTTEYADGRRTEELIKALHQIAEHPLTGEGYLTIVEVHNVPLEMMIGGGVLGFIGFLFVIHPMIRHAFYIHQEGGLSLVPIAWLLTGLTVPRLWDRIIWVGLALALAGLALHTTPQVAALEDAEGEV